MHLAKRQALDDQLGHDRTQARPHRVEIPFVLELRRQIRRDCSPNLTRFKTRLAASYSARILASLAGDLIRR
jgi:hypothetical protein